MITRTTLTPRFWKSKRHILPSNKTQINNTMPNYKQIHSTNTQPMSSLHHIQPYQQTHCLTQPNHCLIPLF